MTTTPDALASLMRIIAARAHGEQELTQKLRRRGFTMPAIEAAVARARELLLLEPDAEIARRYARELATRTGATPRSVSQKLRQRGLNADDVRTAVAEAFAGWEPDAAAWRLVAHERDHARAARRLKRRGFQSETIAKAVDRLQHAKPSPS